MEEKGAKNYDSEDDASDSEDDDDEIFESDTESDHDYFSSKRRKKTEPKNHLDHESYSWCLMNYTIGKLVLHNLQAFLPDVGFELTGLFSWPNIRTRLLYNLNLHVFCVLNKVFQPLYGESSVVCLANTTQRRAGSFTLQEIAKK